MKADEIRARRVLVADGVLDHKSQRELAAELGVVVSTINADMKAIRIEWQRERIESAEHAAAEDLQRLAEMEAAIRPAVLRGEHQAIDRQLKIMERRAKMLGIDAPTQIDLFGFIRKLAEEEGLDPEEAVAEAVRLTDRAQNAGR